MNLLLPDIKGKVNILILWLFIALYLFYFGLISIMKFNSFAYYDFDLAVHDLSIWNILHGSIFNSILGIPFLGNHMHLILFLVAPLYAIFNHPLFLLLLQTAALGMTALPLFRLANRLLDENWALIIGIFYLLYPALGYTNLYEFHPTVFATFFLAMALYYYALDSFPKFLIFAVLSMLCQENIPLAIIMFGMLAIFNRRKLRWIIVPMMIGSLYFVFSLLLMAYFNNNTVQFINIYRHLGSSPSRIISNILANPTLLLKTLFRRECFIYLVRVFKPLSFLPLLSPLTLLPGSPFFFQHLLSNRPADLSITYHYTAELIPFVFVSFVYAIKFLSKNYLFRTKQLFFKILLIILFLNSVKSGPHLAVLPRIFYNYKRDYSDIYKERFISKIPESASVVATFEFLPHLSHRSKLYSLHHLYSGYYTLSDKRYNLPDDVEYALIDFNDFLTFRGFYRPDNYRNLQKLFLANNWQVLDLANSLAMFKKDSSADFELCRMVRGRGLLLEKEVRANIENLIELIGYSSINNSEGLALDSTFYWRCLNATDKDINVLLDIVDTEDKLVMRMVHPVCYRIFPTNSWKKGQIFQERWRIVLPNVLEREKLKLKIGFFDYRTGTRLKVNDGRDNAGRLILKEIK